MLHHCIVDVDGNSFFCICSPAIDGYDAVVIPSMHCWCCSDVMMEGDTLTLMMLFCCLCHSSVYWTPDGVTITTFDAVTFSWYDMGSIDLDACIRSDDLICSVLLCRETWCLCWLEGCLLFREQRLQYKCLCCAFIHFYVPLLVNSLFDGVLWCSLPVSVMEYLSVMLFSSHDIGRWLWVPVEWVLIPCLMHSLPASRSVQCLHLTCSAQSFVQSLELNSLILEPLLVDDIPNFSCTAFVDMEVLPAFWHMTLFVSVCYLGRLQYLSILRDCHWCYSPCLEVTDGGNVMGKEGIPCQHFSILCCLPCAWKCLEQLNDAIYRGSKSWLMIIHWFILCCCKSSLVCRLPLLSSACRLTLVPLWWLGRLEVMRGISGLSGNATWLACLFCIQYSLLFWHSYAIHWQSWWCRYLSMIRYSFHSAILNRDGREKWYKFCWCICSIHSIWWYSAFRLIPLCDISLSHWYQILHFLWYIPLMTVLQSSGNIWLRYHCCLCYSLWRNDDLPWWPSDDACLSVVLRWPRWVWYRVAMVYRCIRLPLLFFVSICCHCSIVECDTFIHSAGILTWCWTLLLLMMHCCS